MPKIIALVSLCLLLLTACNCTYQYEVYVENNTDEPLKIAFKTTADRAGALETVRVLEANQRQRIISSIDIPVDNNCMGTSAEHCQYVAEYVRAFKNDTIPSTLNWCSEKIVFEKMDIQQGQFTIRYTASDF